MKVDSANINGQSIEFIRQGSGEPLILIHGSVSDARTWQKHIDILSDSFDVIAPSLTYFGTLPWPDDGSEFGTQRHATDVLNLIRYLEVSDVTCVGWSYGGNVAVHAGILEPDSFSKLFLYEPALGSLIADESKKESAVADRSAMFAHTAKILETDKPINALETFIDDAAGSKGSFASMPQYVQDVNRENAETLRLLLGLTPAALSLENFQLSTLIFCGMNTREFYRITAEELSRQCMAIDLKLIPDANHLWPVNNVKGFCDELTSLV